MLVANARMYAVTPRVAEAWRALFAWASEIAQVPINYVEHAAPAPLEALWARDDLGLAFMCGLPFSRAAPQPQMVAAPVPDDPRCAGRPRYWTDLVTWVDGPIRTISDAQRIGWTVEHSQSGYAALKTYLKEARADARFSFIGPLVTPRRVVDALLNGAIDVGPLDSYWHALLQAHEPETARKLRVIDRTEPTAMPLLIASPDIAAEAVRLRDALLAAHNDAQARPLLATLKLSGFMAVNAEDYAPLREAAAVLDL